MMKLLITRAEPHASALAEQLTQIGVESCSVPVMNIEPIALTGVTRNQVLDLDGFSTVIVVSANAAALLAEHIDHYWPQLPVNLNWVAIGEATANKLAACLPELPREAIYIPDGTDSEALLALSVLASVETQKLLIVKGEGGRQLIQQGLAERGARVVELPLYRRQPNLAESKALKQALSSHCDWIQVASAESFLFMLEMLGVKGANSNTAALPHTAKWLVPSLRVADVLIAHGVSSEHILCCKSASNDAIVSEVLGAL
ncbi:uroporphyrinogen-III synthase [Litoribacillus peritrichatus]|uniref:Uroporphyrinogen-III synthase n=1 Tax=Litoribacillus peritrichatus TaxID=718191 RepID=A0ABP7NDF6_9GAMM